MNDFTKGSIWKKLVFFAIPLLLSSVVQQLYNTVDLIFVGNYLGTDASAAIGASSLLITCLIGFFSGLSIGAGVVVAHAFGEGDKSKLRSAIHNAVGFSLFGGVALMLAGYFFAPVFLKLTNVPLNIQEDALGYLRIYFFSFISIVTYNISSGVMRALGDSKTPLYAQLIGGIVNVLMNALFLLVLKRGINGVAQATLISQTMAAAIIVYKLTLIEKQYSLTVLNSYFDFRLLKKMIFIGAPAGTQSLLITLSNVIAQYHINTISMSAGTAAIAAFTVYFKVELIIYLPIVAIGQTAIMFVGQNVGAKKFKRVKECMKQCLGLGLLITSILSVLSLIFGEQLFQMFVQDREVIELGLEIIHITFPFYFIYLILQVVGDSLRGMGKTKHVMYIIMINICIIRTVLLFTIVPIFPDVRGIALTYPITWALTALSMFLYYNKFKKNFFNIQSDVAVRIEHI